MMGNDERYKQARTVLEGMGIQSPVFLGQGNEGVVFHDGESVYKVLIPFWYKYYDAKEHERRCSVFLQIENAATLYKIGEILSYKGFIIQKYKYEKGNVCKSYTIDEIVPFLVECWQHRIIVIDCKPANFIRIGNGIKLIDMDATPYNDNLFLNMCVRMFLVAKYSNKLGKGDLNKLLRSAINNFSIPELSHAREFVNRVFASIIYAESRHEIMKFGILPCLELSETIQFSEAVNLEKIRFAAIRDGRRLVGVHLDRPMLSQENYFTPKSLTLEFEETHPLPWNVSLLIKTCAQDAETIEQNIRHIVWQLSSPNPFAEIIVSVDSKSTNFLRQFNDEPSLERTFSVLQKLKEERVIDRYIAFDAGLAAEVNRRWFGIASYHAHSTRNIPVASQLYAFEQCNGEYVLQCDSDVLIGRRDHDHSYLYDMISQLQRNSDVLSVGFNICNEKSKEYSGFHDGGYVPEVRMCLFNKKRLLSSRPWPNSLDHDGRLELSWYRALEQYQKETGKCSIRGGDSRSFYVHPQNYRKTRRYSWLNILDRVEQGFIPSVQYGHFDCECGFRDWCIPKRHEKMVVVSCFRNVQYDRFLRMWCSLMSQDFQDFGIILVDDCSDNGLPVLIENLIKPYANRTTFIRQRSVEARLEGEFIAIRYFISNPYAIVVMLDGDDALIGANVLRDVWNRYVISNADVTVGRVHQTYRLQPHYRYPVDFCNPRKTGGNVWQHLKTFRKYLFDSLPLPYLKWEKSMSKLQNWQWYEKCDDYALMVPIVEMSSNPMQMDRINYYYERDFQHKDDFRELKEACIRDILHRPQLTEKYVCCGRKRFETSINRVELDITYSCNLHCKGCNRSCGQMPTDECMEVEDVWNFIAQSIRNGRKYTLINVLGGEPTLHSHFLEIVSILQSEYVDAFSPETIIQITSNRLSDYSRRMCAEAKCFRSVQIDENSSKNSTEVDYFTPFNDAPIDDPNYHDADFSRGCWVATHCGIGVNKRGYYACAVCGGIDRILGQDHAIKDLRDATQDNFQRQKALFCRYCGNFKHYASNHGEFIPRCEKAPFREIISPTWKKLYGMG